MAASERIRDELGWVPRKPDIETMIADAWNWFQARPQGYARLTLRGPFSGPPFIHAVHCLADGSESADSNRNARACACPPMLRAVFTHTATWPLTALALLAILLPVGLGSSQAAFVAQSTNPTRPSASAASFNTVAVTLTDPGTPLRGVVMLNAVATSSRGIGSVMFQTSPAGANTWTTACTASTSPYSCTWDTTRP